MDLDLLSSHQRAKLRRQTIDQMMSEGATVEDVLQAFSIRPDLQALLTGTKAARQVLKGDIARVARERARDPAATARADHERGLRRTLAQAEAALARAKDSEHGEASFHRVLSEVNRLRQALGQLQGVPVNMARPAGRPSAGVGQGRFAAAPPVPATEAPEPTAPGESTRQEGGLFTKPDGEPDWERTCETAQEEMPFVAAEED